MTRAETHLDEGGGQLGITSPDRPTAGIGWSRSRVAVLVAQSSYPRYLVVRLRVNRVVGPGAAESATAFMFVP